MRQLAVASLALISLAASACINLEQSLTLDRDLSGTAAFSMKIDLEPVAGFMAMMKQSMSGKPGTPTEAEIAEARKDLLASASKETTIDIEKEKADIIRTLPAGVKLLDAVFKNEGLKMAADIKVAFDHASKLNAIKLDNGGAPQSSPMGNPVASPFGGLQVVDEGRTILVTSPAQNPMAGQKDELSQMPGADAAMKAQIEQILKGFRVAFKITSPLEIVEHNAHRKEGATLLWDFNMASLEKMTPEQLTQSIRVRYRK